MDKSHKQNRKGMEKNTIEDEIRDLIKHLYKAEYTGTLKVDNTDGIYELRLGVPHDSMPTYISMQCDSKEEFLEFLEKELANREYLRVYYYKIKLMQKENKKWKNIQKNRKPRLKK